MTVRLAGASAAVVVAVLFAAAALLPPQARSQGEVATAPDGSVLAIGTVRVLPQGLALREDGFVPTVLVGDGGIRLRTVVRNRGLLELRGVRVRVTVVEPRTATAGARTTGRVRTLARLAAGGRRAVTLGPFRRLRVGTPASVVVRIRAVVEGRSVAVVKRFPVFLARDVPRP